MLSSAWEGEENQNGRHFPTGKWSEMNIWRSQNSASAVRFVGRSSQSYKLVQPWLVQAYWLRCTNYSRQSNMQSPWTSGRADLNSVIDPEPTIQPGSRFHLAAICSERCALVPSWHWWILILNLFPHVWMSVAMPQRSAGLIGYSPWKSSSILSVLTCNITSVLMNMGHIWWEMNMHFSEK